MTNTTYYITNYTANNMRRMLGDAATDADARRFATYLIGKGWKLIENSNGEFEAWHWHGDEAMTEEEWQDALADCFRTHEISLDNGLTYQSASEAMPEILERDLWDFIVELMDVDTRERVYFELAPCTEQEFLTRYLEIAPFDLILG